VYNAFMEWWLAILGFVMSLLATADLAHKYGSAVLKKMKSKNTKRLLTAYRSRILPSLFKKSPIARPTPVQYRMLAGTGVFRVLAGDSKKSKRVGYKRHKLIHSFWSNTPLAPKCEVGMISL
jgi:hypothetical protein